VQKPSWTDEKLTEIHAFVVFRKHKLFWMSQN